MENKCNIIDVVVVRPAFPEGEILRGLLNRNSTYEGLVREALGETYQEEGAQAPVREEDGEREMDVVNKDGQPAGDQEEGVEAPVHLDGERDVVAMNEGGQTEPAGDQPPLVNLVAGGAGQNVNGEDDPEFTAVFGGVEAVPGTDDVSLTDFFLLEDISQIFEPSEASVRSRQASRLSAAVSPRRSRQASRMSIVASPRRSSPSRSRSRSPLHNRNPSPGLRLSSPPPRRPSLTPSRSSSLSPRRSSPSPGCSRVPPTPRCDWSNASSDLPSIGTLPDIDDFLDRVEERPESPILTGMCRKRKMVLMRGGKGVKICKSEMSDEETLSVSSTQSSTYSQPEDKEIVRQYKRYYSRVAAEYEECLRAERDSDREVQRVQELMQAAEAEDRANDEVFQASLQRVRDAEKQLQALRQAHRKNEITSVNGKEGLNTLRNNFRQVLASNRTMKTRSRRYRRKMTDLRELR